VNVAGVVLAAGRSTRMGTPKMLLPWGSMTVLDRVLCTLLEAQLAHRLVVVGSEREAVQEICRRQGAETVFNPDFEAGEMLSSLQVGLRALPADCRAALVVLGDQPALQARVAEAVLLLGNESSACLVVPSYMLQRGHPWLVGADWWQEILHMQAPDTPRDFLHRHAADIRHVTVDSDSILRDIDTPDEYLNSAP
jgi:molybdenum cofactor cytidylyltransferase